MTVAGELVARLAAEGIDPTLLADVARELFAAEIERRALEERRQHERERKARSRDKTGQHGKGRERQGPPKDNIKPQSSEANASGGEPPADPIKLMFDVGLALLTSTGLSEKNARSLLGKWRKAKGEADVLTGILDCRARNISNPVEWLEKRFLVAKYVSESGYEYRGSRDVVKREAMRRNDMGTYWKIEGEERREREAKSVGDVASKLVKQARASA